MHAWPHSHIDLNGIKGFDIVTILEVFAYPYYIEFTTVDWFKYIFNILVKILSWLNLRYWWYEKILISLDKVSCKRNAFSTQMKIHKWCGFIVYLKYVDIREQWLNFANHFFFPFINFKFQIFIMELWLTNYSDSSLWNYILREQRQLKVSRPI